MQNVAKKLSRSAVFQERAVVASIDGEQMLVDSEGGRYRAARAVSCLVEPVPGDLVLVAAGEDGTSHVLAVLERPGGEAAVLAASGDLVLKAPHGKVQITGQAGIDLVTPGEANVVASALSVHAARGSFAVDAIGVVGGVLRGDFESVKLVAKKVDQVLERFSQRVKASYRTIEELDRVRAKNVDHVAQGTMKVHARETVMTADGLVKVDGEQIHIG
jgi:ethanolamine utilization microcompartment shell protein EutS